MHQGNRAIRRHHAGRIKKQRCNHWGRPDKTPREIGMLLHTAAQGCRCCRNPRRDGDVTIQERRALQNIDDQ